MKAPLPADFSLRHEWHEGSMPPPYHYEYIVRLSVGAEGEVIFFPDYPQHDPPVWRETFPVDSKDLAHLYALLVKTRAFARTWRRADHPAIGGSVVWLDAEAGGKKVTVPPGLPARDAAAIAPVYDAIRAVVPQVVWDGLMGRYEKYQAEHAER